MKRRQFLKALGVVAIAPRVLFNLVKNESIDKCQHRYVCQKFNDKMHRLVCDDCNPYKIEVLPIPESLGGGFTARLPEIGQFAVIGDGETVKEAIKNLEEAKRELFKDYLEKGLKIPESFG